ncbi:sugar-transfer associated ATP-grasp domain-containing protein [Geodermatophilus sp. DSM 44513]|uniref:sugar-transfer associated ATP-grasp domain-containing protein n=1 Tax=Geodermatophilus sp. DSM 44513 TaxID=1528104 RepID=UPI001275402B|nr:sugar-transfer associated ATP-grasp domain-containing protein [Geodermatophilus sp. DSM 44513]WNV76026.1 sugar-transfer associated ATP-grasp domain-containing protein [Geodermatophilus sp. DSM 44513]
MTTTRVTHPLTRYWPRRPDLSRVRRLDGVLGINARNERIARDNPTRAIKLVDDKHATKTALAAAGAPTAPTLAFVESRRDLAAVDWAALGGSWALKPNQGLGGSGIVLATAPDPDLPAGEGWLSASGRRISRAAVLDHARFVLDGEFSGRPRDAVLVEPLIRAHPDMAALSHRGLPDVRVLCLSDEPVMAMVRLPTSASGGRANLHQGAIGAAVELGTGVITGAWVGRRPLDRHPDTGVDLVGAVVPCWDGVLDAATRCGPATGLHYVGADVVVDRDAGPLVLEVNARPGLQIQNVNGRGLAGLLPAA